MEKSVFERVLLVMLPIFLVLFMMGSCGSIYSFRTILINTGKSELNIMVENLYFELKMYYQERSKTLEVISNHVISSLTNEGIVEVNQSKLVQIGEYKLPELSVQGRLLSKEFSTIDEIANKYDAVITIFQLSDNELVRINSTIKDENNDRAIGSSIDSDQPIYTYCLKNGFYQSITEIKGKRYLSDFKSIRNKSGKIVGAIAVYIPDFKIETLFEQCKSVKVGITGYFYLIDRNGKMMFHPKEDVIGKDFSIYPFIKDILRNADANSRDAFMEYTYEHNYKIVKWKYIKEFDCIVVANAPVKEFLEPLTNQIILVVLANIVVAIIVTLSFIYIKHNFESEKYPQ